MFQLNIISQYHYENYNWLFDNSYCLHYHNIHNAKCMREAPTTSDRICNIFLLMDHEVVVLLIFHTFEIFPHASISVIVIYELFRLSL